MTNSWSGLGSPVHPSHSSQRCCAQKWTHFHAFLLEIQHCLRWERVVASFAGITWKIPTRLISFEDPPHVAAQFMKTKSVVRETWFEYGICRSSAHWKLKNSNYSKRSLVSPYGGNFNNFRRPNPTIWNTVFWELNAPSCFFKLGLVGPAFVA